MCSRGVGIEDIVDLSKLFGGPCPHRHVGISISFGVAGITGIRGAQRAAHRFQGVELTGYPSTV